jgi:hypothetical protein
MNTNPLHIAPGTLFISGAKLNTNGLPDTEAFIDIARRAVMLGLRVFNPEDHPECDNPKVRFAYLAMCDVVVTTPEWGNSEYSRLEVKFARLMGKEVVFGPTLEHWAEVKQIAA